MGAVTCQSKRKICRVPETRAMAERIVEQSWHSLREGKALVDAAARMTYAEGLAWERAHSTGTTPDLMERLATFGKRS